MKDDRTYLGQWKNDLWWGSGKLETPQYTYTGAFVRGLFEGKGKIEYKDDSIYDGELFFFRVSNSVFQETSEMVYDMEKENSRAKATESLVTMAIGKMT